jgi:hypothetical protein
MTRLGLILLGALLWAGCSKEAPLEQRVILHPNKSIWKKWTIQRTPQGDTLIHGAYKEFYWNGSPSQVTEYRYGVREGTSQAWYDNGNSKWTKVYRQNKREGVWRLYSSDGRPLMEANFKDGLMHGPFRAWDKTDTSIVVTAEYLKGQCSGGACGAKDSLQMVGPGKEDNRYASLVQEFLE